MKKLARKVLKDSVFWPLLLLMLLTVFLVSPMGDFPLNDDWAYANNVKELIQNHRYVSSYMALAIAQTIWGYIFTVFLSLNFTALRFSTLALSFLTLWATARIAGQCGLSRWTGILCSFVVLSNPIFLNLSYTFMTEVPFVAPMTIAGFFYMKGIRNGRHSDIVLGGIFAVIASSIRQFGVIMAAAFGMAEIIMWVARKKSLRPGWWFAFLSPWIIGIVIYLLLPGLEDRPPALTNLTDVAVVRAFQKTIYYSSAGLIYLGLFLLPLALARLVQLVKSKNTWSTGQWIAFPWLCLAFIVGISHPQGGKLVWIQSMPILGNILRDLGTGPLTLRDTYLMGMPSPISVGSWWWLVTILSILSAAIVCIDIIPPLFKEFFCIRIKARENTLSEQSLDFASKTFLLLWGIAFVIAPYHLVMSGTFDRYLIPCLPPLIVLFSWKLSAEKNLTSKILPWILCSVMFLFSLAAVQDYLAWNSARWEAINYLRSELNVHPYLIDGGYEYNGLYTRDEFIKRTGLKYHNWGKKGFWVIDDTFAVSFNPRPGYKELKQVIYYSWLGIGEKQLYVLRKQ